jgi:outer membrane lipoprotein-sorting protein
MILRHLPGLSAAVALAACLVAPASAQAVPNPRPRPAHLTAKAAPVPVAAAPVAAAPTAPASPAPTSIGEIAATSAVSVAPAPAEPSPVVEPVAIVEPQAEIATAPAGDSTTEEVAAPLNIAAPQPAPIEVGPVPGTELAAASPVDASSEAQTLSRVNTYFNGIRTLVGNFTQVGPDGSRADGKFFLQKPGKVRFYYQRPSTTDIIADGKSLVVRDRKLATQDVYPLSQTPLKFLLDANMDLSRDSKVTAVYEEPGLVSVAIEEETTFGGKARILLVFGTENKKTFELKQWTITDPQGLDTTVALSDLDTTTRPDEKLFAVDYTHDSSERR